MLELLNQAWFGSVVGIAGLIFAVVGLVSYRAARIGARPVYFQRARRLIGKKEQELPEEVEITFNGHAVPRLTSTQCFFWNAGKSSISGGDIVPGDPLRLEFDEGNEIVKARIVRTTRSVNNIQVDSPPKAHRALITFDFLDPGDGALLELLHTSALRFPKVAGTIKGIPRGLVDVAGRSRIQVLDKVAARFPFRRGFFIGMFIFGIAMLVFSLIPKEILPQSWFESSQNTPASPQHAGRFVSIMFFILGLLYMGLPALVLYGGRRRYPAGLDLDIGETDKSPNKAIDSDEG